MSFFFVKMIDGVIIEPEMPSNQFKKLANKTMKSEAGDRAVRNLLARVERKLGEEKAQEVRVELATLRNDRVSKAPDWVSQLPSTEQFCKCLYCQLLYSCQVCHLLPARAASWYLLRNPNTRPFWARARCGEKSG